MSEMYFNGEYKQHNPTWHTEDSPWKAKQVLQIMNRNNINIQSICEVGCGAGEILNTLHDNLPQVELTGYEVSEDAYNLSLSRTKDRLGFKLADLLAPENTEHFDLLLVIDVFEHIEDYFTFLRKCKEKSEYKIFHIPLEISVQTVLRMKPLLSQREKVGHLHYFSKEIALSALRETGYEVIDFAYTDAPFAVPKTFKGRLLNIPRKFMSVFNQDLAVRIFGGYSMIVLAR